VIVSLDRPADLSETDRAALRALSEAVYPPADWADWPGRRIEWAPAEWCVRFFDEAGELASYVGVLVRLATLDGRPVVVGGIGGVKTHPAARGRGYAAAGLKRAVEYFRAEAGVGFGLLVCDPGLVGYYARLGWQEFDGRLVVRQHGATADFTFNRPMTIPVRSDAPVAGMLDLNGPPW
jgi:aminoglycoside 2'-N-acetyltransferase I